MAKRFLARLRRLFKRKQPTAFQRCLAVHIHFASNKGALQ